MLKLDEILKSLEEIDKVIKETELVKQRALSNADAIVNKYSARLNEIVESIVRKAIEDYKTKALGEAKEEASRILQEAERRRSSILSSFEKKRREVLESVLRQLGL